MPARQGLRQRPLCPRLPPLACPGTGLPLGSRPRISFRRSVDGLGARTRRSASVRLLWYAPDNGREWPPLVVCFDVEPTVLQETSYDHARRHR